MKKILLAASLLCLLSIGVNAQSGTKPAKKSTTTKTTAQKPATTTAASDTSHHKSTAMNSKHYKRHKAEAAKTK